MHKSVLRCVLYMVSYFKYKKHCQPLCFWLPVSQSQISSLSNHLWVKCCSPPDCAASPRPPRAAQPCPRRWRNVPRQQRPRQVERDRAQAVPHYRTCSWGAGGRDENENRGGEGEREVGYGRILVEMLSEVHHN